MMFNENLYTSYNEHDNVLILESNSGSVIVDLTGQIDGDNLLLYASVDYDGISENISMVIRQDYSAIINYKGVAGDSEAIELSSDRVAEVEEYRYICVDPSCAVVKKNDMTVFNTSWLSFCVEARGMHLEDKHEACTLLAITILMSAHSACFKDSRNESLSSFIKAIR